MRYIFFFYLLVFIAACDTAQPEESNVAATEPNGYNQALAEKLGADDYGMKTYVMAFLKAGPNRSTDSLEAAQLQRAHLDNIIRLAEQGTLVLAGPFMGDGEIRGIYVFDVESIAEAEELTSTDPAIQKGSLVMELRQWYGSAAIMEVNRIHEQIARIQI